MAGVRMGISSLTGHNVEMYEVGNDEKPLVIYESIGKAGRAFGYYNKNFATIVRGRKQIEITYKGRKISVYFKEK
jgi:hypothetical protein